MIFVLALIAFLAALALSLVMVSAWGKSITAQRTNLEATPVPRLRPEVTIYEYATLADSVSTGGGLNVEGFCIYNNGETAFSVVVEQMTLKGWVARFQELAFLEKGESGLLALRDIKRIAGEGTVGCHHLLSAWRQANPIDQVTVRIRYRDALGKNYSGSCLLGRDVHVKSGFRITDYMDGGVGL